MFEREIKYFKEHKEELLKHYKDQYVVIKVTAFLEPTLQSPKPMRQH